jgi:hypothetical protein
MTMKLENIQRGRVTRPLRINLYGIDKIGKTTFAAHAPSPIFIQAEDGQGLLDLTRFPTAGSWDDIMDAITELYDAQDHGFETLVIDSTDWAESLCLESICADNSVTGIEHIPYGKGYKLAREKFAKLFRALDALWLHRHMHIILISHCQVKRFDDPNTPEPYDRYLLKLDEVNSAKSREWADILGFASFDTAIKTVGEGLNQTKRAVSYGKRYLHLERSAAFDAGNRYGLPARIPLEWEALFTAYQKAINDPKA